MIYRIPSSSTPMLSNKPETETKQVPTGAGGLGEVTVTISLPRLEEADPVRLDYFSDAHLHPWDI